jgi:hypothetical protein
MTAYHVKFFKHLLNSSGHPFKVLQRIIDIRRSKSRERALEAAQHRFERAEHMPDWKMHADTIEVQADKNKTNGRPEAKPKKHGRSKRTS